MAAINFPFFVIFILGGLLVLVKAVPYFLPPKMGHSNIGDVTNMEMTDMSVEEEDLEYSDPLNEANSPGLKDETMVPFCPPTCTCSAQNGRVSVTLCKKDPSDNLDNVLKNNVNATSLAITSSQMSIVPSLICNLTHLSNLDLSDNKLQDIPWECLKNLKLLLNLHLTKNSITTLRNGTMYGFQSLENLYIDHNNITEIESDVFVQIKKLPSISEIRLSHNHLRSVGAWFVGLFNTGRSITVSLDQNLISNFTNDFGLKFKCNLIKPWKGNLDLSDNKIEHVTGIFEMFGLKKDIDFFCLFNGDMTFDLRGNPFNCDCTDYRFYAFLHLVHKSVYAEELFCDTPEDLYNQKLAGMDLNKVVCNVKEKCPQGCTCTNIPNKMNMEIECRGTGLKVLPDVLPDLPKHNYRYSLYFSQNNLTMLTNKSYLLKSKLIDFDDNDISNMTISAFESLTFADQLQLRGNNLSRFPDGIANVTIHSDFIFYLEENPWNCDCFFNETMSFLSKHKKRIVDKGSLLCSLPIRFQGDNIFAISAGDMICGNPPNYKLFINLGIGGGTFVASILIFVIPVYVLFKKKVWLYKKLKWHPFERDECEGEDKEFDVFVSYANEDEDYVDEYLLPELQDRGYRVCYHRVHFPPGEPIINSIEQCIKASKRTLVVISNNFIQSQWCMWEFSVALEMNQIAGTHRIMAILYDDVDITTIDLTLRAFFSKYTYIEKDSEAFLINLEYGLPQNKMGREEFAYDVIGPPRNRNPNQGSNIPEEEEHLLNSDQLGNTIQNSTGSPQSVVQS